MKIILVTYGSRGDVLPVLALATALNRSGHEAIVAGPPEHEARARTHHCPFRPIGGNFKSKVQGFPDPHTLRAAFGFVRLVREEARVQFSRLPDAVNDADLVLGASLAFAAHSAAELAGVPYGFIALCPQILPSAHHPPLFVKNHGLSSWMNRTAWGVASRLDNVTLRGVINRQRRHLGLPHIPNAWNHLLGDRVMVASDAALGGIPDDVSQLARQVGHFALEPKGKLTSEVEGFLASGPAPIYAGFGSMFSRNPEKIMRLVLQAARSVGRRVIVARGWSDRVEGSPGEDCLIVDEVHHPLLFPRVAAVVHHGGSGTTATAARAGVPQVIVPHILDQFYWANRVFSGGLGPKSIPRNRLNAGRLSEAFKQCLTDGQMRQRAEDLGRGLRNENGLARAVETIESGFFLGR